MLTSIVDSVTLSHRHLADDYRPATPDGCGDCGALPGPYQLERFGLKRIQRYRDIDHQGSYGPGAFNQFDIRLYLHVQSGDDIIEVWDPREQFAIYLTEVDAVNGLYHDKERSAIRDLQLFTDASLTLPATSQALATHALITDHKGETWAFEIIDPSPKESATYRAGRLISHANGNGQGCTVAYIHPRDADLAIVLGNDPEQLWRIRSLTDAYGASADVTTERHEGQWVISAVTLPSGESIDYYYDNTSLVGLDGVGFPDGTTSTFSAELDVDEERIAIRYDDAGADDTHRRKVVLLTPAAWNVGGNWEPRIPNRVRAVDNGVGERIYENWLSINPADANQVEIYVRKGGDTLSRLTVDRDTGNPVRSERSRTPYSPDTNWYLYDWELIAGYEVAPETRRISERVRPTGTRTGYMRQIFALKGAQAVPQPSNGRTVSRVYSVPDGLGGATTLGEELTFYNLNSPAQALNLVTVAEVDEAGRFAQPTIEVDRAGRATLHQYDLANARPWLRVKTTRGYKWDPALNGGDGGLVVPTGDEPSLSTWEWSYRPADGQLEYTTDANGNTTVYFYTANGLLETKVEPADEAGGTPPETHFVYYPGTSLVQSITDPEGRVTRFDYDSRGRVADTEYGDGSHERREYGTGVDANLLVATIDRRGVRTRLRYDR
ncbi:MAG: RHS repeat protein, partial [Planctomycetota bacterium]|nr:RHS repeat protein [Planctomycetota bacterium]